MDSIDLANFSYQTLDFGEGQRKKEMSSNSMSFSAMKRVGDVCIRIANHRTKLRTWLNNIGKKNFPKYCVSIVCLCGDDKLDSYPGDISLPADFSFTCKEYVYDFTKFTKEDLVALKNDINATFKNKSYPNNILPNGQKPKPCNLEEDTSANKTSSKDKTLSPDTSVGPVTSCINSTGNKDISRNHKINDSQIDSIVESVVHEYLHGQSGQHLDEKLYNPAIEPMIDGNIGEYEVLDGAEWKQILCDLPQKGWVEDIRMYSAMGNGGKTYCLYRRQDNGKHFFTEVFDDDKDKYLRVKEVSKKDIPTSVWNDAVALIRYS